MFRLLLDEMTEARLAEYCDTVGHDVVRVVDVPELGPGSDDADIVDHAERKNRLVVTTDDDFLTDHDSLDRIGVLFQADDSIPPFETANIIDTISEHVEQQQVAERDEPFHLTTDWV